MKTPSFFSTLDTLNPPQQICFAAAILTRSAPNYQLFLELTQFGDIQLFRQALNLLWDFASGQQNQAALEKWLPQIEQHIPDREAFDMYGVHPATDAMLSLSMAMNCALSPSSEEVDGIAQLALKTIGQFLKYSEVPELKGTELQQYIEQHPLYLQQLDFYDELLDTLAKVKLTPSLIKEIKTLARNDETSHLGISISEEK
ncbi:DUF416 family protein [Zooshikella harenae]|uniref:DUF416 family protein n=1 Tax=Zooshikella harenae TaxID=2827238 RepID=A0ABS5Z7K7_9GAMM|nr:DUF416 family protein [Zooshikella harenae]MBU2710029.1 DUF416 family protein [Zooshikella harenae]